MAAATKKKKRKEAYPWRPVLVSGTSTKLKQSIFAPFDIYGRNTSVPGMRDCILA